MSRPKKVVDMTTRIRIVNNYTQGDANEAEYHAIQYPHSAPYA